MRTQSGSDRVSTAAEQRRAVARARPQDAEAPRARACVSCGRSPSRTMRWDATLTYCKSGDAAPMLYSTIVNGKQWEDGKTGSREKTQQRRRRGHHRQSLLACSSPSSEVSEGYAARAKLAWVRPAPLDRAGREPASSRQAGRQAGGEEEEEHVSRLALHPKRATRGTAAASRRVGWGGEGRGREGRSHGREDGAGRVREVAVVAWSVTHAPGEEVDVDERVLAVDEVQVVRGEHYAAHRVGHRAQHDYCTHVPRRAHRVLYSRATRRASHLIPSISYRIICVCETREWVSSYRVIARESGLGW